MVKQVIVMRKDLNMRKGKMVSQGCHASMKVFFDIMKKEVAPKYISVLTGIKEVTTYSFEATDEMIEWIDGKFTKICVSVDSEQELLDIYNKAKESNLPCALIEDCGLTEFNGVPTKTCCCIGPDLSEKIDKITGHLKLL